jgi:hypothetical protein
MYRPGNSEGDAGSVLGAGPVVVGAELHGVHDDRLLVLVLLHHKLRLGLAEVAVHRVPLQYNMICYLT